MIISDKTKTDPMLGNGLNTIWPFSFKVWADGVVVVLTINDEDSIVPEEEYTLEVDDIGGTVTYPLSGDPLQGGEQIIILREMDFLQKNSFQIGRSDPKLVEDGLDRLTATCQQLKSEIEEIDQAPGDGDVSVLRDETLVARDETLVARDETLVAAASISPSPNIRQAVQSYGLGINIDSTQVKGNEILSEVGTAPALRLVDFLMDMKSGNKNGMSLIKDKDSVSDFILSTGLLLPGNFLKTNATDAMAVDLNKVSDFTVNGIELGPDSSVNANGKNFAEFAMQTTHKKVRTFTNVKSVILDIADNWGSVNSTGFRSIDFYYQGTKLPLTPSDFTVYSTTKLTDHDPKNIFDTSLSKLGTSVNAGFLSSDGVTTNQRIAVVFIFPITFDRMVINNHHNNGTGSTNGGKNTEIYITPDAVDQTIGETYEAAIPNSELIFDGVIAQHPVTDTVDDRGYCGVIWAYNPATGFFMLLHDGTGSDFPIQNVTGKDVVFCSSKELEIANIYAVYTKNTGLQNYLELNDTTAVTPESTIFLEMSETQLIFGTVNANNRSGNQVFSWGFVGDDLGDVTPGGTGIKGSSMLVEINGDRTFDCGVDISEIQTIKVKRVDGTSNWDIYNAASGWDKNMALNLTNIEGMTSLISINGSNITTNGYTGKRIVLVIGKNGDMPSGKTININADSDNPVLFGLAHGFRVDGVNMGQLDYMVGFSANASYGVTEEDGTYTAVMNALSEVSLLTERPLFNNSPGVMKGVKKLPFADVTILDGSIVDMDLMPEGNRKTLGYRNAVSSAIYILDNPFFNIDIDFKVYVTDDFLEFEEVLITSKKISKETIVFTTPVVTKLYLKTEVRRLW